MECIALISYRYLYFSLQFWVEIGQLLPKMFKKATTLFKKALKLDGVGPVDNRPCTEAPPIGKIHPIQQNHRNS